MNIQKITIVLFILLSVVLHAQDMATYTEAWEGKIANPHAFNFDLTIDLSDSRNAEVINSTLSLSNQEVTIDCPFQTTTAAALVIPITKNIYFKGALSKNKKVIRGFIKSGMLLYHIELVKSGNQSYQGKWNPL